MKFCKFQIIKFFSIALFGLASTLALAAPAAPDDLHIHLNGAFSLDFLHQTAAKNNSIIQYKAFLAAHDKMIQDVKDKNYEALLPTIWQKFGLIHQIVQTHEDITQGTVDVIVNHPSAYLEIRTTPKSIEDQDLKAYIDAFVEGINQGRKQAKSLKAVKGILSIDRTKHNLQEAMEIVEVAALYRDKKKPIVGIDISGNPSLERRTLSGQSLKYVLEKAIEKQLCLGIHFAEAKHMVEQKDSDVVLDVLEAWHRDLGHAAQDADPKTLLFGKVRLGHVIFPTESQAARIRALNVPIELCPTGHRLIGWWANEQKHPVHAVYSSLEAPIALGTDDPIIFDTDIHQELAHLHTIYELEKGTIKSLNDLRFTSDWG